MRNPLSPYTQEKFNETSKSNHHYALLLCALLIAKRPTGWYSSSLCYTHNLKLKKKKKKKKKKKALKVKINKMIIKK